MSDGELSSDVTAGCTSAAHERNVQKHESHEHN